MKKFGPKECIETNACYKSDNLCTLSSDKKSVDCVHIDLKIQGEMELFSATTGGQGKLYQCLGCSYQSLKS